MSVTTRLGKLEAAAEALPCPLCGRGKPGPQDDVLPWVSDAELDALEAIMERAEQRRACTHCGPRDQCPEHRGNAARVPSDDLRLRNCTTAELKTIRGILVEANRRAGVPCPPDGEESRDE